MRRRPRPPETGGMPVLHPGRSGPVHDTPRTGRPRRRAVIGLVAAVGLVGLGSGAASLAGGLRTADGPEHESAAQWLPAGPPPAAPEPEAPARRPAWDDATEQRHAAVPPSSVRPAEIAGPGASARECGVDDLSLVADGWDAWSGHTSVTLTATNVSGSPCLLGGWPDARLLQGEPLALTTERTSTDDTGRPAPPPRLFLRPGHGAASTWQWRGYRAAADARTPQRLDVRVGSDPGRRIVPLGEGPAPFDVVSGATIEVGAWAPARRAAG